MKKLFTFAAALLLSACASIPAPTVRPFADTHDWVLVDDLIYHIGKSKLSITVPKGFVTDFASIPKPLWSLGLSPYGRYSKAAIIHDYLYWTQECSKEQADNILLIAMKESGVDDLKAFAIYGGVSLGGKSSWQSNAKERQNNWPRIIPPAYMALPDDATWAQYRKELLSKGVRDPKFTIGAPYCQLGNSGEVPIDG